MSRQIRTFEDVPAVRERVPLLVGIDGCSSSGKTWSALRLATGMQRIYGGDIRLIDTDSGRGKHYTDYFKYRRVPFPPPFGSLDYLDAITATIAKGGIAIVDHMSAEHDGEGGMLDTQEEAKNGKDSRNAVAWKIAKGFHHQLVRAIQQIGTPVILLWRAADKLDWKTGGEPKKLGMMPIGSKDLIFEMTVNAYLPPAAKGVPNWTPAETGEKMMTKLPEQFREIFKPGEALCERHGEAMARWAMGSALQERPPAAPAGPPAETPATRIVALLNAATCEGDISAAEREYKAAVAAKEIRRSEGEQIRTLAAARREALAGVVPPDLEPGSEGTVQS
jgi:hypothetical protein